MDHSPEEVSSNQQDFSKIITELPTIIQDPISGKRFRIGKLLGQGGFAKCYQCSDLASGTEFCCKAIYNLKKVSFVQRNQMNLERDIQKSLGRHPHIVKYFGRFAVGDHLCMILELCTRGTLLSLLMRRKRLTEPEAKCLALQFCHALIHMQENDVLHRDLKLANLLLTAASGGLVLKIADFGLAANLKTLSSDRRWTLCGTPNFLAPEVIDGTDSKGYGFPADIWSLGVVIYVMLVGSLPFASDRRDKLFRKIQNCEYKFPPSIPISDEATDLIQLILQKDPASRPSIVQIIDHPFFTKNPGPNVLPFSSLSHAPSQDEISSSSTFSLPASLNNKSHNMILSPVRNLKRKRTSLKELQSNDINKADNSLCSLPFNIVRIPTSKKTIDCPRENPNISSKTNPLPNNTHDGAFEDKKPETVNNTPIFNTQITNDMINNIGKELDLIHRPFKVQCTSNTKQSHCSQETSCNTTSFVYVTRWIDSDVLFGFGYQLCHGVYGLLFKDLSSLLACPGISQYKFISYNGSHTSKNILIPYPDLNDRNQAFSQFIKSMNKLNLISKNDILTNNSNINDLVYVSRVIRNPEAIIFVLSSQTVQFNFKVDHIRFILEFNESRLILLLPNRDPLSFLLGSGDFSSYFHNSLAENLRTKLQYCLDTLITLQKEFVINSTDPNLYLSKTLI